MLVMPVQLSQDRFLTLLSNGADIKLCDADSSFWNTASPPYATQINVLL